MKVDGIMSGIQNYYEPIGSVKENNSSETEKVSSNSEEKINKKEKAEAEKVVSEVYGDVLSKSADGDVTTAAKQSLNALSDGLVLPKENAPEVTTTLKEPNATKNKIEEQAQNQTDKDEEIDSLTGYTSNQLDTLYAEGKISKYDYDQEVERRAELTQEEKRIEINEPKEKPEEKADETEDDEAKAALQQEIEGNNAFAKNMAKLNETAINDDLKTQALDTAKENGRLEIMNQILGNNN